jgi:hypothetical protein
MTRTGETLIVKTNQGNVTVVLTDSTKTKDDTGVFGLGTDTMSSVVLIPGLKVDVDGTSDDQGRVVAKTITVDGDDLETSEMIQSGLHPTAQQVAANLEARVRQAFCVNGGFFLAPQAICGRWKSGNPGFGFPAFPWPTFDSSFLSFFLFLRIRGFSALLMEPARRFGHASPVLAALFGHFRFAAMPTRLAGPGRLTESQNAARPPSNSVPASSTSWQYAPAPETAVSSPHPHSEMIRAS